MERQVTIREIAKKAGVSTATVSNVIHGRTRRVSPATIERVRGIMESMGYGGGAEGVNGWGGASGYVGAGGCAASRPRLVALVVNTRKTYEDAIGADPFYGKMIGMVEQCLRQRGYYMIFYSASDIDDIFQMAMSWKMDGVITITSSKNDCRKIAGLMNCPLVSIDAYGPQTNLVNIGLDDWQGGYIMTQYLMECGYNPIYVCAGRNSGVDHLRYEGCRAAGKEETDAAEPAGKKKDRLQIRFAPLGMDKSQRKAAFEGLVRPVTADIQRGGRPALFCLSDMYALEALSFFTSRGMKIPEDLGIAGFDDIFCSSIVYPGLTTVRQDMKRKAELAVERLAAQMEGGNGHAGKSVCTDECVQDIFLPVKLVARGSACPIAPSGRKPAPDYIQDGKDRMI